MSNSFIVAYTYRKDLVNVPLKYHAAPMYAVEPDGDCPIIYFRSDEQVFDCVPVLNSHHEVFSLIEFNCFSDMRAHFPSSKFISVSALMVDH